MTAAPRKYGFHGTLKPPFRLAAGRSYERLEARIAELAHDLTPATCGGLRLTQLGQFLALVPGGETEDLAQVAGVFVKELDTFRAPASAAELTRRRAVGLTPRQAALLNQWGYPYVLDEFRFHLTLTGKLPPNDLSRAAAALHDALPDLPDPFVVDAVALVGERRDGVFEVIRHYKLSA